MELILGTAFGVPFILAVWWMIGCMVINYVDGAEKRAERAELRATVRRKYTLWERFCYALTS